MLRRKRWENQRTSSWPSCLTPSQMSHPFRYHRKLSPFTLFSYDFSQLFCSHFYLVAIRLMVHGQICEKSPNSQESESSSTSPIISSFANPASDQNFWDINDIKDIKISGPGSCWFLNIALSALKDCTIRSDSKQICKLYFLPKKSEKDIRHWLSSCCSAGSQIQPHQLDAVSPWFYHLATNWGISGGYAWNIAQLRELCQFCIFFTSFSPGFGLNIDYRHKKLFVLKKKSLRGKSWYEFTKP